MDTLGNGSAVPFNPKAAPPLLGQVSKCGNAMIAAINGLPP